MSDVSEAAEVSDERAAREALASKLEEVARDVRKQGRAAVAAQAAAEACHEAVRVLAERLATELGADEREGRVASDREQALRWLRALLPVADAVERLGRQAGALKAPRRPRWWPFGGRSVEFDAEVRALAAGAAILARQLDSTLGALAVDIDRPHGLVDPERHRVVEVRPATRESPAGTVVEVVRAGYAFEGITVREADVVASAETPRPDMSEGTSR
jgi:16S rRNA C967 or C1407 C5-methylase (RsmB/RsmF family)